MQGRKTMQCKRYAKENESWCGKRCNASDMQKKTKAGAENDAMQTICKGKRKLVRQGLIYMHEKTDLENNACNANDKAMSAMQ